MFLFRLLALGLVGMFLALPSPHAAAAQEAAFSLRVSPALTPSLESQQLSLAPEQLKYKAEAKAVRRGRLMAIAGFSLLLSGLLHAAVIGKMTYDCRYAGNNPHVVAPIVGSTVAVAGIGLIIGGARNHERIPAQDRSRRHRPSAGGKAGMVLGAFGLYAVSQLAMFGSAWSRIMQCSNS